MGPGERAAWSAVECRTRRPPVVRSRAECGATHQRWARSWISLDGSGAPRAASLSSPPRAGSPQASLLNAGVLTHPRTGVEVVGSPRCARHASSPKICRTPRATVVFRSGREWAAAEGDVELSVPVASPAVGDQAAPPTLVQRIYASAVGGEADEWAHLDEQFAREGHTAVLLHPMRVYPEAPSSPSASVSASNAAGVSCSVDPCSRLRSLTGGAPRGGR